MNKLIPLVFLVLGLSVLTFSAEEDDLLDADAIKKFDDNDDLETAEFRHNGIIRSYLPRLIDLLNVKRHLISGIPRLVLSRLALPRPALPTLTLPSFKIPSLTIPSYTRPAYTIPAYTRPSYTLPAYTLPALTLPRLHTINWQHPLPFIRYPTFKNEYSGNAVQSSSYSFNDHGGSGG